MLDKVKVGGLTYNVECFELIGNKVGWTDSNRVVIQIDNQRQDKQRQEQTLIHEIVHAMFDGAGLIAKSEYEEEQEEDVVNRLGIMLHQVLKDNDFSWLYEDKSPRNIASPIVQKKKSLKPKGVSNDITNQPFTDLVLKDIRNLDAHKQEI